MWEVICFCVSGDRTVVAKDLDEERAKKYVEKLNKKCDWTQHFQAFKISEFKR